MIKLVFTSLFACLFSALSLSGQDATGRVIGTVTDAQGGSIAGARVTVVNVDTKATRNVVTDKDGAYEVVQLPIGTYSVTVEGAGFRKAVIKPQVIEINRSLRVDVSMEVGAVTETVQVEGQAQGVETVNSTLGQSVTTQAIVNLPLNGRNVLDLALLVLRREWSRRRRV